jgi:hypothetical protein
VSFAPRFLHTRQLLKQRDTMNDMLVIARAVEAYRAKHGSYPRASSMRELRAKLGGLPEKDAWGAEFAALVTESDYFIGSGARDGVLDRAVNAYDHAEVHDYDCDIIFDTGAFVRYHDNGLALRY